MRVTSLLPAILLTGILSANLSALPLSGVFSIGGTINVTTTQITWNGLDSPFIPDQSKIGGSGNTGSFAGLNGTTVTIMNLTNATEPVGTFAPAQPFMSFDAAPLMSNLNISTIFAGLYTAGGCTASPAAVGQTCTPNPPITPSASPFSFVNNPGAFGPQATATFAFSGVTADGLSTWTANFTSQFNIPFQQVLANLAANGSVSDTYSATVTVVPNVTTPEPGTPALMSIGLGLVVLSLQLRRRKA